MHLKLIFGWPWHITAPKPSRECKGFFQRDVSSTRITETNIPRRSYRPQISGSDIRRVKVNLGGGDVGRAGRHGLGRLPGSVTVIADTCRGSCVSPTDPPRFTSADNDKLLNSRGNDGAHSLRSAKACSHWTEPSTNRDVAAVVLDVGLFPLQVQGWNLLPGHRSAPAYQRWRLTSPQRSGTRSAVEAFCVMRFINRPSSSSLSPSSGSSLVQNWFSSVQTSVLSRRCEPALTESNKALKKIIFLRFSENEPSRENFQNAVPK